MVVDASAESEDFVPLPPVVAKDEPKNQWEDEDAAEEEVKQSWEDDDKPKPVCSTLKFNIGLRCYFFL